MISVLHTINVDAEQAYAFPFICWYDLLLCGILTVNSSLNAILGAFCLPALLTKRLIALKRC
jgi:hypothetical protein